MSGRSEGPDARRLAVQQTASRVLLEAASLEEAIAEILRVVAVQLDWALAIHWVADEHLGQRASLRCRSVWAEEAILRDAVVEASRTTMLRAGEDPAGRAMQAREAVWIERAEDEASPRLKLVAAAGLRTVAAFPVHDRTGVRSVIELYARDARPPDDGMLHLMTAIGYQICLVFHRQEAQTEALEALERSRDELAAVLRALPDGITVRDGAGRLVYANEVIAKAAGASPLKHATPTEMMNRFRMWDEAGGSLTADDLTASGAVGGVSEERLVRYRPIGGEEADRWLSVKVSPVAAAGGGEAGRVVIVMRDVTDDRRDQVWQTFLGDASTVLGSSMDLVALLEELAALAARTVADGCAIVLRRRGGVPRVLAFAGATRADTPAAPVPDKGRADALKAATAALETNQPRLENTGERSSLVVPFALRGETVGAVVLAALGEGRRYSAPDLRAAEELARRASIAIDNVRLYAETQESLRAREDLLAIVSHDLRNPLGVVLASSALLLKSSLPPEPPGKEGRARRQVEAIQRAGNRMNRLIRDLLDFAAIQAGRLSVSSHPRQVDELIHEVLEALEPLAAPKSMRLVDASPGTPLRISCDHDRVIQLFSNVVGNAVKFTPDGGTVSVAAEPDGDMVRFAVTDDGPGISKEELPYVFDRYYQARRRNRDGIGLGLSIARGIVEAHGGRIWVESPVVPPAAASEDRGGTTFFFTLPAAQQ